MLKRPGIFSYVFVGLGMFLGMQTLLQAQHMPSFVRHTRAEVFNNPAWASEVAHPRLISRYRTQWLGYASTYDRTAGAPSVGQLQFMYPLVNYPVAGGLSFTQDDIGPLQRQFLQFILSYRVRLTEKSHLSFGLMPVYAIHRVRRSLYRPQTGGDPVIDAIVERPARFDVTLGTLYTYEDLQLGLSVHNITSSSFQYVEGGEKNRVSREMQGYGGYTWTLIRARRAQKGLTLTPSLWWRTDWDTFHFLDVLCMAEYDEQVRVGLGWRRHESLMSVVGVKILKQKTLDISYGFEFIVQNREGKQLTSHEIRVAYDLLFLETGKRKPVRTPRFRI